MGALLFGVDIRAPDFWKLPYWVGFEVGQRLYRVAQRPQQRLLESFLSCVGFCKGVEGLYQSLLRFQKVL